jgi:hypothetical protein
LQETLKLKHLSDYFPDFIGDNTVEDACKFFAENFNAVRDALAAERAALAADTRKEFMQEHYEDETWEAFNKRRAAAAAADAALRREQVLFVVPSIAFDTEIVNKVFHWARFDPAIL